MRLERLSLLAYGPFTNAELALEPGKLVVVYGPNEAGKSTTLRAIDVLLFGFESRTQDDHVHDTRRLRVGGALASKAGARFEFVRRKGNKDTVLDPQRGEPVDDAPLVAMLGGASRDVFRAIHGLDHDRLRAGGQTLLEGAGRVGESLFAASMGVVHLHRVLARLEAEADDIHQTRRGHLLGKSLDAYDDARKRASLEITSGETVEEQRRRHGELVQEIAALREAKQRLDREREQLQRVKNVWQKIPERDRVERALEELGPARPVDPAAREVAEREVVAVEPAIARLEERIAELEARRAAIELPPVLLAQGEAIAELHRGYGAYLKAARDRASRLEQLAEHDARDRAHAARLGADPKAIDAGDAARKRLRRAHEALLRAEQDAASAEKALRASEAETPSRAGEGDPEALDAALATAKDAPSIAARVDAAERERARLDAKARARLPALGLPADPVAALGVSVPSEEAARAALEAARPMEALALALEERLGESAARAAELGEELDALEARSTVPREDALAASRAERDALVDRLARGEAIGAAVGRAIARADALADAMRADADTVSRASSLARESSLARARAEKAREELAAARAELAAARAAWDARWAPSGLAPRAPSETLAWLREVDEARGWCARVVELDAELERDRATLAALREGLEVAAESARVPVPSRRVASAEVSAIVDALRARREALAGDLRAAEGALAARRAALAESSAARARLEAAQAAWAEAARAAGLVCAATTTETEAALAELDALAKVRDAAKDLRRRVDDIDRDAEALREAFARIARTVEVEVDPTRLDAIGELYARHAAAEQQRRSAADLDADLRAARGDLEQARARLEAARAVLAKLVEAVGAADVAELRAIEERTARVRAHEEARAKLDHDLAHLGDGRSLDELRREAAAFTELDEVRARLERLDEQYEQTSDELERATRDAAGVDAGLREYDEPRVRAAEAAAEAEVHLARARELGEQWLRLRLAHDVLRKAIDRMRSKSQGPVLGRASELFARLTLGAYKGLQVDVDDKDEPILLAVRDNDDAVGMLGLSDGTRDQLYLALRVASLERLAKDGDPLPLVLDDVLVDFDDARARAALAVLAGLAAEMQVLLFTHHAHLVELAREAVPDAQIALLPSASVAPAA